ncbi:hypothetical protein B7R25_08495 [Subtercola boreus]|uniref:Uncharacterized protein n=1 Tax=Subtercola boreus TaxID=120213 RepID=A0A3E0WAW5_9MICO|nr:hypothetical protein B7R24_08430 [Subtercola boreus]RFA20966.1 hypothetical protein B7R23_08370 [Subtercola boreus]RFA27160.1 hypothetical protein B7R25_08495 [Subtercola boreus]
MTALLLAAIGLADLCRNRALGRGRTATAAAAAAVAVIWLALATIAVTGLGVPVVFALMALLAAGGWLAFTTSAEHRSGLGGRGAVVGLVAVLILLLLVDRTAVTAQGFLVDGHADAPSAVLREVPLAALALGFGVLLFLCESANILVRTTLRVGAGGSAGRPTVDGGRTHADLKGGRLIGPLERLLIVGMVLAGYYPIVAALVAAKGIVRFPEIANDAGSGDGLSGTKAEYFLVGSLVSWAVAGGAIVLLAISARS